MSGKPAKNFKQLISRYPSISKINNGGGGVCWGALGFKKFNHIGMETGQRGGVLMDRFDEGQR